MLTCLIEPCLQRKGSECCGLGPSRPVPVFEVPGGERVCVYVCGGGDVRLAEAPVLVLCGPRPQAVSGHDNVRISVSISAS